MRRGDNSGVLARASSLTHDAYRKRENKSPPIAMGGDLEGG